MVKQLARAEALKVDQPFVRGLMAARGMTRRQLGRLVGCHSVTVTRVLRNYPGVSPKLRLRVLQALAETFNITIERLSSHSSEIKLGRKGG